MLQNTFYRRLCCLLARPSVRRFVVAAVFVEAGLVVGGLSIEHREHIAEFSGYAIAQFRGEATSAICAVSRDTPIKVVRSQPEK